MNDLTRRLRRRLRQFTQQASSRTGRKGTRRRFLSTEKLEDRQLLAADLAFHNSVNPTDVNSDFLLSPIDALLVINELNRNGSVKLEASDSGSGGEGESSVLVDVNGDGFISPIDALMVINALNAEAQGEVIQFRLETFDTAGNAVNTVTVGQEFTVRAFVQDIRGFPVQPTGVFSFYSDVMITNFANLSLTVFETQELKLGSNTTDGNFNLLLNGQSANVQIAGSFQQILINLQSAVDLLYGANKATVVEAGTSSNPFIYRIRFDGMVNTNVPNMTADPTGLMVSSGSPSAEVTEIFRADASAPGTLIQSSPALNFVFPLTPDRDRNFTTNRTARAILDANGVDGILDEIGAAGERTDFPPSAQRGAKTLIWEITFTAAEVGRVTFQGDPPDLNVSDILLYGQDERVNPNNVDFGGPVVLNIVEAIQGVQAVNDNFTIDEDSQATEASNQFDVLFNDVLNEGNQKILVSVGSSANGTATIVNNRVHFRPNLNFNGPTSFTYVMRNELNARSTGTVFVTVLEINDPPIAVGGNVAVTANVTTTISGTTVTANDSPGPANESNQTLTVISATAASGTATVTNGNIIYTPPTGFTGNTTITYVIRDNGTSRGQSAPLTATGTLTVSVVNDPPVAVNDDLGTIDEFSTDNFLDVLANDGPPTASLRIVGFFGNPNGTVTIAANGTHLLYTPTAGFVGPVAFDYTIEDAFGLQATATVTFDVVPVVRPRAVTDRVTIAEKTPSVTINVLANDLANVGAQVKLKSVNQPASGQGTVVIGDNNRLVYSPPSAIFNGVVTFTYVINDTLEDSDPPNPEAGADSTGTVIVTITEVNDPPVAVNNNVTTDEDTPRTIAGSTLTANDSRGPANESNQTLTVTAVSAASAQGGTVVLSGGSVVYTPRLDFNGIDTFTYVVTDNGTTNGQPDPKSATGTVTVTVTAVNDAPIAASNHMTTDEDVAATVAISTLLENDRPGPPTATDELATQTVAFVSASSTSAQGGTVVQTGNNLIYTPKADFNGTDTFTYVITDDGVPPRTATGTVTVTVVAVNDPPRLAPDAPPDTAVAFKDQALQISTATLLATKVPGPPDEAGLSMSVTAVQPLSALGGTVTLVGGTIFYVPPSDVADQTDTIVYTVTDNGVPPESAEFSISVEIKNFQPSSIGGFVYVDVNDDGIMSSTERRITGVEVRLTGTDFNNQPVNRTVLTDASGKYTFGNVSPGNYTVAADTPDFYRDGKESINNLVQNGGVNDRFSIQIQAPGGVELTNHNFGERGLEAKYVSILEFLASTPGEGGFAAVNSSGNVLWTTQLNGYTGIKFSEFVLSSDPNRSKALLTIVDANDQVFTAELNSDQFYVQPHDTNGSLLIRFNGSQQSHNFGEPVNISTAPPRADFPTYLTSVDNYFSQF